MSERRYDDDEIAAIFRAAADGVPARQAVRDTGFSLAELQSIGREVGISPDAVANAAAALDVRSSSSKQTWFGLPIGVSRTVELGRRLSDDEWDRLVGRLRETFDAHGKAGADGSSRHWRNGNLHVLLELTTSGHRLRFRTFNAGARALLGSGLAALGITVAVAVAGAVQGNVGRAAPGVVLLAMIGLGMIASGALRLPSWARLRARQMEALGAEVASAGAASRQDE